MKTLIVVSFGNDLMDWHFTTIGLKFVPLPRSEPIFSVLLLHICRRDKQFKIDDKRVN